MSLWSQYWAEPVLAFTDWTITSGPVGRWNARIGRVTQYWGEPCWTTPELWVEAAWRSVPYALLAAVKPSPVEGVLPRFGPRAPSPGRRGGGRHGRRPNFKFSSKAESKMIGKAKPGSFAWGLFKLPSEALRAFQWIQFVDLALDELVTWHSLVYQYAGCQGPSSAIGSQHTTESAVVLGSESGTIMILPTTVTQQVGCIGAAFTWACNPADVWSASYSINWRPIDGLPAPNPQFILQDGTGQEIGTRAFNGDNGDGTWSAGGFYHASPRPLNPFHFNVVYTCDYSFIVDSATFNVTGSPRSDILQPDP